MTTNSKTAMTKLLFAAFIILSASVSEAMAQETKLKWHGHADAFAADLKKTKIDFYEMKPGATISFRGKQLIRAK